MCSRSGSAGQVQQVSAAGQVQRGRKMTRQI
jgi:hypothetical protein